jgi:hypothetical protein
MLPAAHDSASAQLLGQLAEPGHGPALNQRLQNASHGRHCSTRTPERQARYAAISALTDVPPRAWAGLLVQPSDQSERHRIRRQRTSRQSRLSSCSQVPVGRMQGTHEPRFDYNETRARLAAHMRLVRFAVTWQS